MTLILIQFALGFAALAFIGLIPVKSGDGW
jgi:hypothetical protein